MRTSKHDRRRIHGCPGIFARCPKARKDQPGVVLIDSRESDRYAGLREPIDPVAGHVPGASNVPFTGNLTTGQTFLSQAELALRYAPYVAGWDPRDIVCMCGSGVTACQGIFALALAGVPGVALYPGSWSEWIRSTERPVATG